jgi:hypothetical protein
MLCGLHISLPLLQAALRTFACTLQLALEDFSAVASCFSTVNVSRELMETANNRAECRRRKA